MPSFDVVSKADLHEIANAVDQANRELATRFDFKDSGAKVTLKVQEVGQRATQTVTVRQGIDADHARKLVKLIKDAKLKVQTAIQGDELRVSGKKRDDLQTVIALLRKQEDFDLPLQFVNFRD